MNYKLLIIFTISTILALSAYPTRVEAKPWNEADYPAEYSAKEIRAKIVDAESGEPVKEAVVVAVWTLGGPINPHKTFEIKEALTDQDGWFYIPGWGPKERPPLTYFEDHDPIIHIFKVGYKALSLLNRRIDYIKKRYNLAEIDSDKLNDILSYATSEESMPIGALRESIWHGMTIKLHKPKDEEDYWLSVSHFQRSIGWSGDSTNWASIKHSVREIEKARKNKPDKYHLSTLPDNARKIIYREEKP